jgi:argininosuccinate lyase
VPFREAHDVVGKSVLYAIGQQKELHDLSLGELRRFSKKIDNDVFDALSLDKTLAAKDTIGGTSPKRVRQAIKDAKRSLIRR